MHREREEMKAVCAGAPGTVVCLCRGGWIWKRGRTDGLVMRKQNDSHSDDQIIILRLKRTEDGAERAAVAD